MMVSVHWWPGGPGFNPRLSHTKDLKMIFDASLPNTQHYKVWSKGKVKKSRERSSALPYTYRKRSFTFDYDHQLYLICNYINVSFIFFK